VSELALKIEGLTKRFGGLVATDKIALAVVQGEVHAVIGPNGAGKTTLIGQLSGELRSDAGRILFEGRDVTRLGAAQRASRGIGRSYQITSVFLDFTTLENVAFAVQARSGHSFHFWRDVRGDQELTWPALAILQAIGLGGRAGVRAADLSHGERRQLEIGMTLAMGARLLLLDEPLAGMGADESVRMIETIRGLKGKQTIVLVEHDMNAVFSLADRITVLVYGRIIASGVPDAIRANPEVQNAYFG